MNKPPLPQRRHCFTNIWTSCSGRTTKNSTKTRTLTNISLRTCWCIPKNSIIRHNPPYLRVSRPTKNSKKRRRIQSLRTSWRTIWPVRHPRLNLTNACTPTSSKTSTTAWATTRAMLPWRMRMWTCSSKSSDNSTWTRMPSTWPNKYVLTLTTSSTTSPTAWAPCTKTTTKGKTLLQNSNRKYVS